MAGGGQDPSFPQAPQHSGKPTARCAPTSESRKSEVGPTHLVHHQVVVTLVFVALLEGYGAEGSLLWPCPCLPCLPASDSFSGAGVYTGPAPPSDQESGASEAHGLGSGRRLPFAQVQRGGGKEGTGGGCPSWRKTRGWSCVPKTCCRALSAPQPSLGLSFLLVQGGESQRPGLIQSCQDGLSCLPILQRPHPSFRPAFSLALSRKPSKLALEGFS